MYLFTDLNIAKHKGKLRPLLIQPVTLKLFNLKYKMDFLQNRSAWILPYLIVNALRVHFINISDQDSFMFKLKWT